MALKRSLLTVAGLLLLAVVVGPAHAQRRAISLGVIGFGQSETARRVTDQFERLENPSDPTEIVLLDSDQTRAAAKGAGYTGSLNLTVEDARNLGSAIGADYFWTGSAETLRRSPSEGPFYFESYASVFLVSGRTGKLVFWERQEFRRPTAAAAEQALLNLLAAPATRERYRNTIRRIADEERQARAIAIDKGTPVIESLPDDETNSSLRAPRPFRRLKPPYPEAAAHDLVEATVDVLLDVNVKGSISQIEIVRWAGYGLDESVINTVKQLDFFPAMRDGVAIPMRVLLRYNFRKPPR